MNEEDFSAFITEGPDFLEVNPKKTALVIVDMQYDNVHPDYGAGLRMKKKNPESVKYFYDRAKEIVTPNILRLIDFFRKKKIQIIYITFGPNLKKSSDLYDLGKVEDIKIKKIYDIPNFYPPGSIERQVIPELKPGENDLIINKTSAGAFATSAIDAILRNLWIKTLIFTGVATNMCVESTFREAADRSYNCVIVDDACATYDQQSHDASIKILSQIFGKSKATQEIIDEYPWNSWIVKKETK
ncbi:MAG: cysteine hydrolase [Actinobacteria bacterium]|nr:cysteine hydrolase [Actinomycetota bacterium]MCL6088242.1 cysteine hydrolase [Actinomycetota bacterium]